VAAGLIGVVSLVLIGWFVRGALNKSLASETSQPTQVSQPKKQTDVPAPPTGMVYVPGGEFMIGRDEKDGGDEYERPAHKVTVKPFFMDQYEVTNEDYAKLVKATGRRPPSNWVNGNYAAGAARRPVTGVTWDDATAYAKWSGKRLPTEEEWEFAARGTDGRLYPWGNDWSAGLANAEGASNGTVDVGTYKGTSPFGAYDMVGNAWQWTASKLTAYPGGSIPVQIAGANLRVIRGGTYASKASQATATYRRGWPATGADNYNNTGFRCVEDVKR
jgi:serine/threonine-protein kinase